MLHETAIIPADEERRKADRLPMMIHVQLSQGLRVLTLSLTSDLSTTGLSGTSDIILQANQEIRVGINGLGTVPGTIAWVRGAKFGARFKDPIDIGSVEVSGIIQPHVPLPDWFPVQSASHGHFGEPDLTGHQMWDAVKPGGEELQREKPRDPRSKIAARVQMRKSGFNKSNTDILDISRTGLLLDCSLHLNEGERFLVILPGLQPLTAIAVWRNDFRTGCKFENPISEYVYSGLLGRLTG
jgi:PilZ domain